MEKKKDVLPLLATETMVIKNIEFHEVRSLFGEMVPHARVEVQYFCKSMHEYFYPQHLIFDLQGQRANDVAKLYKTGDVIHCRCELIVATKH